MSEPFWKQLVDAVRDERREHLDPVRREVEWRLPRPSVERELLEEMAGALGRAEQRVHQAIARALELATTGDDAAFEAARVEALRCKRDLAIHREALRFPHDPEFDRRFPVPPPRAARRR